MKPENQNDPDRLLQTALRAWSLRDPLPPRFAERVWQRITLDEARRAASFWPGLIDWIGRGMARPALATGYLAVLLLSGLGVGYWQARTESIHASEELGARYVHLMDPYLRSGH